MKLKNVEIHNILSFEHGNLKFGDTGLVLVEGFDYDTGRANGAGKSAIFNAISFAVYDKVPRKITKSEILRKGTKQGFAYVEIETPTGTYGVRRERPVKVTYYKDGKVVDMTQEAFEKIIGLNYEQFLVTMYTAQDAKEKFINLNDTGKKDFILKIMNLSNFTKAKNSVTEQIKVLEQSKELAKAKLTGYKSNINIYKESIVDPTAIQAKLDQLNKDIDTYNNAIVEFENVKEPDLSKYAETESKIQNKLINIQSTKTLAQVKRNELQKLKNMTPDTVCPDCNVDLNIVNGHAHKAGDQSAIDDQILIVSKQINEYEDDMAKESEIKAISEKIKLKKQEEYFDYNTARSSISEYRSSIRLKESEKVNLINQLNKNEDIKTKVKQIITSATVLNKKITDTDDELFLLNAVGSVFETTGAPAYVMDSIVDSLNAAVSEYVSEIWPSATYMLTTYKTNKDKSIKAKFSETLTINGKERSIGSLSGGELRALSLALDFAIVEVLSSQHGLSLNPVILDEAFNGLDDVGKEMVMDILVKFSETRQIWVIDHSSEFKSSFNRVMTVEKRSGISKITESI